MPSSTVYKLAGYYTNICESVFFITTFSVNKCRNRGTYRLRAAAIDYVRSYYQIAGRRGGTGRPRLAGTGWFQSVCRRRRRTHRRTFAPPSQASAPIPEITFTDICPWLGLVFRVVGLLFRFTIGVIKSIVSIWSGFTVRCKVKVPILQLHCESKKQDTYLLPITSPNIDRFSKFFTVRLSRKFVTKSCTNTPTHPKRVAILPCEISVFKKSPFLRSK